MVSACTRGVGPTTTKPSVGPTTPEQAPLPGRPANVRVSQDEFVAHAEPCLAVNPRDPRNLLGACIAHDDEGGTHIGAYASFDAGASWRSLGGLEDSADGRDPTVTFDPNGRGYVCANTDDLHIWPTHDGGRTFGAPVLATRGHKLDHPWLAADPSPGPPSTTHLYGIWTGGPDNTQLEFGRSATAAAASSPHAPSTPCAGRRRRTSPPRWSRPATTAPSTPSTGCGRRSQRAAAAGVPRPDQGRLLHRPRGDLGRAGRAGTGVMEIRVQPDTNGLGLPTVVAHPHRQLTAAAFVVRQPGTPSADIAVCQSRNQGRTGPHPGWCRGPATTPPIFSRSRRSTRPARWPCRRSPTGEGRSTWWCSPPSPTARFGPPVRVTSRPFDPARGTLSGKHGAWWIGDYQGLASAAGRIHPFWNDPAPGDWSSSPPRWAERRSLPRPHRARADAIQAGH